jgi:outer membrane protein assembly factor BamB
MQIEMPLSPMPQSPELALPHPAAPRRLWMAFALVGLFWVGFFIVGRIEKPYFYGFLYSMASAALLLVLYSVWWWTNRGITLRQRLMGFALVVATGVLDGFVCHKSLWFALPTVGLPAVLATGTLWMLFVKISGVSWKRQGAVAVVALTWGYFALLRLDGADGDLQADVRWRWQPTEEDLFLAGRAAANNAPAPRPTGMESALRQDSGDWIAFRGANRDGVVHGTNIPTDWRTATPKQLWQRRVGPAWSSVVVIGDRLFTQEQRGQQETVVCYQADTGKELWVHEDAVRFEEAVSGAGPRATPTFANGRLYTMGATGILNCLDAKTDTRYWSQDVTADAGAKPPMWGYSSSPLVVGDLVIAFAGGKNQKGLLAYRCESGKLAWTADTGTDSYSSPQRITLDGKPQCLILTDAGLFAVEPATGSVLWQYGLAMPGAPRTAQPNLVGDGQLAAGSLEGPGVAMIHVGRDGSTWKTESVWATAQIKPEFPDFVVHQGHIYGFDVATFCCIDAASGERCWRDGRYGRGQVLLLADQGLLLVISEKGEAVLLAANPRQREERGKFQAVKGKTWNHPVIAHGRLYVRNAEWMACYELTAK